MRTHCLILAALAAAIYTSALAAQESGAPPEPPVPVPADQAHSEAQRLAQAAEQVAPPPEPPAPAAPAPADPAPAPQVQTTAPPPGATAEATAAPAPAPTPTPASGLSPLNFNNAEIGVVLKYLSDKTGKPVLKSEGVTKQVTLINPRAQTDAENLRLLYKVLSSMGIAVVDAGDLIMVMPLADARKAQIPLISGEKPESGAEDIMTFSRQLKFTKAKDLVDRLKPMVRDGDALSADESSNTLFYSDTRSYVERFANLVDMVDREKSQQITTASRAIKNASASEILVPCQRFLQTYASVVGDGSPQTTIRVEPTLNTLIIRGPAREVSAVNEIVDRLDVSPKVEVPRIVRRRPVSYTDPQALIQSAEAFLRRFIEVGGLIGDVPKTSLVYEPSTRELIIKGPEVELDALMPVLDELDKPRTTRSRKLNYADPRSVVDEALTLMVKEYADSGRPGYKHSITWKADPFNPSILVFRGPAEELDRLLPLLNQLDMPVTTQTRRFFKQPEQVFPEALKLLVDQYLHDGIPKYKPVTTWRRDPLNPAQIILRGPTEELTRLTALLDQLDKPLAERTRPIYSATPEVVIPAAIERMVKRLEEEGQADYRPSITWKREDFNPSILVIKGPPAELDRLFPILDQLDKPLTTQARKFNNRTPEEVFPQAIDLMLKQYAEEGQPNYRHSITWKRDPLNASQISIKGPADELTRLSAWLERLDVVTVERVRKFYEKSPEEAIPAALEIMVKRMADAGQPGYRPITEWKKDELKPADVIFRGPAAELDILIPLLDQIDKAVTVQQRRFYTQKPEEVFASALTLLTEKYEKDGQVGFKPSVTWDRDPFDPSMINLRGPQEELAHLTLILDQLDKPLTERTRQFYNAKPEEAIPGALERLVRKKAEEGNPAYRTATTWRREEFNPSIIIFRGPPAELDLLIPILDNLDKPLVVSSRAISNTTAEEVIPQAQSLLKQYFKDQGRAEYEPITTFRVDPINHNLVMRGPQEEITALTIILAEIDVPRAQTTNLTTQEFAYNLAQPADLIKAASSFLARRVAQEGKPGDKPGVTYQVNPLTRSISLRGPAAQIPYVVSVMTAVEQTTRRDSKPLIIYPKRTTAAQLYTDLYQFVTAAYPTGAAPQLVQLPRLDALVISARPEDQARLQQWIDVLDSEGAETKTIKMIPVENTVPSTLVSAIRTLLPSSTSGMYPDDASSRLIIRDSTAAIDQIRGIVKELDQPIDSKDIIFEVKHFKAASIYSAKSALDEFSTQLAQFSGKAKSKARIILEPTSLSVLIFGKKEDVKQLVEMADKLDVMALGDSKPRMVPLKNAQASQVYSQISSILPTITNKQNPPVIIPDARMNSLLVAASPADVTKVIDLIQGLDAPSGEAFEPTIVKLENAEVSYLYSTISQIMTGAGKVFPDYHTNSLILFDTKANIDRLMPFIKQLDTSEGTEDLVLEIYKSQSASIYYLYSTLYTYANNLAAKKGKARSRTVVQYEPYTSRLILLGEKDDVKDLLALAEKMDKVPLADSKPTFIFLKNAQAAQVSSRLTSVTSKLTSQQNPPTIIPDTRLNMLIVAGSPVDASKIQEIVKAMDVPGSGLLTQKLLKLENAEASTLSSMVQPLLSEAGKAMADSRTNSLLIMDSTDSITRVMPIIEKLDTAESKENFVVRVVQVKTANVYAIYNPVSQYVERMSTAKGTQQRGRPMVTVDASTQAIIAIGREDDVKDIIRIAGELDKLQWQGQEPEFFQIKNGVASTIGSSVRALMPSVAKGGSSAQVIPDDRINLLIVLAQPADLDRIRSLVEKLDVADAGDLVTKIIPLKFAPATSVYYPLTTLKSPRGYVTYDYTSNSIVIRDTTASLERLEKLIVVLDTDDAKNLATRIIPLKNAPATSVYNPVYTLKSPRGFVSYDTNSNSLIIRDITPEVERLEKIASDLDAAGATGEWVTKVRTLHQIEPSNVVTLITNLSTQMMTRKNKTRPAMYAYSEPTSGSLIIIGPTEEVRPALDLVDQLETAGKAGGNVRLFFLKYTKAMQLANQLSQVFRTARTTAGTVQTTVISDQFTNSLIAIGSDADLKRLDELVAKLDIPNAAGLEVEIFPVEGVSAAQLVTYLDALSGPQGQLASDPSTNSLVVIDTRDVIQRIGKVVKELAQKGGGITARIHKLDYGQAVSMVAPITQYLALHATRQGRSTPRSGVYPEPSTNAVIIFGPTDEVTTIEALIKQLDTEEVAGREPRIFTLKYLQVSDFLRNLAQMVTQSNMGGVRSVFIPEQTTNSLIVIAPDRDVKRLEAILQKIDVPDASGLETRVFELKRASADNLANNLAPPILSSRGKAFAEPGTDMLIVTDTPDSLDRAKRFIDQIDMAKGDVVTKIRRLENTSVTALSQPLEQFISYQAQSKGLTQPMTQIMTEPSSNSLIISGPTDEIDLVMGLIQQLDAESLFEREPKIIPLRKAKANALAPVLQQLLALDRTGANMPQVLPEPGSNSVIILAPKADILRAEELLVTLDQTETPGVETHVFRLKNADAETLLESARVVAGEDAKLFSDVASNSLIYIDTTANIEELAKLIERLDVPGMEGEITTQVVPLKNTNAGVIDNTLDNFVEQIALRKGRSHRPLTTVSVDRDSNSVVIIGSTDEVELVKGLIAKLDAETLRNREPKIIALQKAHAATLAPILEELLIVDQKGENVPRVFAEPESNSLILLASKQDAARAQELLTTLDQTQAPGVETHIFRLKNAEAQILVPNIRMVAGADAKLFADMASNSIVYTDTTANIEELGKLIDQLDAPGMEGNLITKVVPLKNTNASVVDNTISEFVQHISIRKGRPQRPLTRITSDATSNSVVIIGPTDEVDLVLGLITELDAETLFDREPKIIPLKKARAITLATVLEQLLVLDKKGTNIPRVLPEPESNSLILLASKVDILRAQELLATLDQTEAPGVETHVFRLKNADAQALVVNVRAVVGPLAKIFADVPSNAIICTDTTANIEQLGKLIEQLDTPGMEGGMITKVIPLRNTTATVVDTTLSEFVSHIAIRKGRAQRPLTRVTSDASTNSVVIIGPTDEVDQLTSLLGELDKDNLREREPKTYFLENAQAIQVGTQITQIMAQISTGTNAARIVPNAENNALLVMANPSDRAIIEQMIKTLDSPEGGLRRVHILKLKNADAMALAQSLRLTLSQSASIASHADSNSVIIADTDSNVQKLTEIIQELDQASQREDLASEVFALENSKAGAIAQPLQMIISQFNTQRQRKNKLQLQSFADVEANSLVIIGASDEVHQLGRIVKELDAESLTDRKPEVFFLEYARATDLQTEITQLFTQAASRMGTPARIVADTWANALLVIADPRDMDWIRRLIKELDTREGRKRVVEIFTLENADASVLSERLQGLFNPGSETGGRSRRRSYYDDFFGGRRGETLTEGQVTIIADQRLNALIVTAEPQDMNQVADLIDALDIQAPNLEGPKVYHIENGEAETLAQTLQSLFSDTDYQGGYYYPIEREAAISGLSGKVRVTADATTNSIIVMASSPRAFDVIEQMLKELDKPSVQSGRTNIIQVKNALAQDLKKLLTDLFKADESAENSRRRFFFNDFFGGGGGGGGGGGSSFSNLIGKVRIEADTRTNSLLVITPEMYRPSVEKLIESLDAPTQQVLLETLIVEVTLGNDCDQGIKWGVDPTTGNVGSVTIGNREVLSFDNDRGELTDSNSYGSSVFNSAAENLQFFSLNSTSFNAVVNFLESNRKVNVQSRPSILTANNQKALVRVGTRTPTIKSIDVTSGGSTNTSVEYEKLGLTLTVTPHINSQTVVSLSINLTDGAIDPTVEPLNGQAYTFTDREFNTNLQVENHHTAVLAGVISEQVADQVHKVPFLNRLPYVGNKVFTNTARSSEKVELLTFITPYILNSQADVLLATEMSRNKTASQILQKVDLVNGDWPEVFVDEQGNPIEVGSDLTVPENPPQPAR